MIKNKISVIVPLYGNFDERRTLLSVQSILNQKNIDLEVVISEQGISPKLGSLFDSKIKYTFKPHNQEASGDFNPGMIRNIAVAESNGEFLYTNDGDIIFLNPNYLNLCLDQLNKNSRLAFKKPLMRRLPLDNFEEFWNRVQQNGIESAICSLDLSQEYLATIDGILRELKVVRKNTPEQVKVFTASMENFRRYLADPSLKGKEPTMWSENLHCGGNFFRRQQFESVGGYCSLFLNWGCEDSDLQWKIGEKYGLEFFPTKKEFEVLHLDHPKGYFSPEKWKMNEAIENERKRRGIDQVIAEDKNEFTKN